MESVDQCVQQSAVNRTKRDWPRLLLAHAKVGLLCPLLAATFFSVFSPDRGMLLSLKGLFALGVTIFCTYVFFGLIAFGAVLAISPAALAFSKIPGAKLGMGLALAFGGAAGWILVGLLVDDIPAFRFSAALTAGLGVALLESAWRGSQRPLQVTGSGAME